MAETERSMSKPGRTPHIVVLVHEHGALEPRYLLHALANVWRERDGVRVTVLNGPQPDPLTADLAILHVDLTVVPANHLEYVRQYPQVINARVADISKRTVSTNLVHRGDGFDGPAIVKTNRNSGGRSEAALAARHGSFLQKCSLALRRRLPWSWRSALESDEYPIFKTVSQVPRGVWRNRDLVVERFLPERRDGCFCVRTWTFLGDRELHSLAYARQPIVSADNIIDREPLAEVPLELRRMRRELGFDYGKFDYAIANGRVVLFDVDRTPLFSGAAEQRSEPDVARLAEGVLMYLR